MFRFAGDGPVSFVDNRRELTEALDRDGAPLRHRDIHLLEQEIQRAHQYKEQAERLRAASRRCGEGLPEYDDGITRDPVCNSLPTSTVVEGVGFLPSFVCLSARYLINRYSCRIIPNHVSWRRGVVVTALVVSAKLLYVEPG